jgi:NADP-dependent 3-hydroxy acid dehydrogenase YdfG
VATRHLRVSSLEPGLVATELQDHLSDRARAALEDRLGGVTPLEADDIAEIVAFIVTRPQHVAINELLVRPTQQVS